MTFAAERHSIQPDYEQANQRILKFNRLSIQHMAHADLLNKQA